MSGVILSNSSTDIANKIKKDYGGMVGRNTVTQELLVGERHDYVHARFQDNVPYLEPNSKIKGVVTGTGSIGHDDAMAVLHTGTGVGSAALWSKDAIRYVTGHEFYAEMTAFNDRDLVTQGDIENTVIRYGVGDTGGIGDAMCFTIIAGEMFIEIRADGVVQLIPRSEWNGDQLDGSKNPITNPSGKTIYDVFMNLWTMRGGWYGILPLQFGVFAEADKGYIAIHTYDKSNKQKRPHLGNPVLGMFMEIERTSGAGADLALNSSSWRGGIVGKINKEALDDRYEIFKVINKAIPAGDVPIPVITIRNAGTYFGKPNHTRCRYGTVNLIADGTKPTIWQVFHNGILTGAVFTDKNVNFSTLSSDTSATAITPTADEIGIHNSAKVDNDRINLFTADAVLAIHPNDTITLTAMSANNTEVTASIRTIGEH